MDRTLIDNTVTFTLDRADVDAFQAYWRRHSPYSRRLRRVLWTTFILLSLLPAWLRYDDPVKRVLAFFLAMAVFTLTNWLAGHLTRRLLSQHRAGGPPRPGSSGDHTVTLTESAVIEITRINESRHLWSGVHKVVEVPGYIFIFVTADLAHVIPKRAFPEASAASAFAARAKELLAAASPVLPASGRP
jgi:hypothetical protein